MDTGHQSVPRLVMKGHNEGPKGKLKSNIDRSLKVKYISSPVKVKTCASRFRSLVQHLTGKNSDIDRYMDVIDSSHHLHEIGYDSEALAKEVSGHDNQVSSSEETSSNSNSHHDNNAFITSDQMEGKHLGDILSWDPFCDPFQLDVLGNYDELL